jgi:hypothetical protein
MNEPPQNIQIPRRPEDDPEYSAILFGVGQCLARWSMVEHALARLFAALMGAADPNLTSTAFDAVISFETRLDMVNAVAERSQDVLFRESWNALHNKLSKLYRKRHQVAHFTILYNVTERKHTLHPFFSFKNLRSPILSSNDLGLRAISFAKIEKRLTRHAFYILHQQGRLAADVLPEGGPAQLLLNEDAQTHEGTTPPPRS